MTGKAIITLCDAESGRVISRTEEKNLVTNAVKSLFSPPQQAMFSGWAMSELLQGCLPMYKNILGGIMLLGDTVEENEENILLPSGVKPIGFAGDQYSGSNVLRGTLNLNESCETDNGYHFTWDFPTDKANGTIRCVALTNRLFGNVGFNFTDDKDGSMVFDPYTPSKVANSPHTFIETQQDGFIAGSFSQNHILRVMTNQNIVTLRTFTHPIPQSLRINDNPASPSYVDEVIELPCNVEGNGRFFVSGREKKLYFFAMEHNNNEFTTIRYFAVDAQSPHSYTEDSVTIPYLGITSLNAAVYGGALYIMTSSGTAVYGLDGTLLRSYDAVLNGYSHFFELNGAVYSAIYKGGDYYYQNFSYDEEIVTYGTKMRICPAAAINPPYIMLDYYDSVNRHAPVCMCLTNYLATINNLSSPIEKTASQTLKIEYIVEN